MKYTYLFIFFLLTLLSSPFLVLAQTTYNVISNTDDGTGQTGTLSQAILLTNVDAVDSRITFSVNSVTLTGELPTITESLTILGVSTLCPATASGGTTIVRANNAPFFRILRVRENVGLFLQDLVLVNGRISGTQGGGIYAEFGSLLTLNRCRIQDCAGSSSLGGGIFATGYLDMNECIIINNTASFDGGIYLQSPSASPINRIRNSTIQANTVRGIYSGGMSMAGGELLAENSTFSQNEPGGDVSSFLAASSDIPVSVTLSHVTIYETSSRPAVGTTSRGEPSRPVSILLTNCLIVAPVPLQLRSGGITSGGGNVFSSTVIADFTPLASDQVNVGSSVIDLRPIADNGNCTLSHAIGCSSVAANAGVVTPLTTDQRGAARFGPAPDAGSFEVQSLSVALTQQPASGSSVCAGSTVTAGVSASGTGPLSYQWYKDGVSLGPSQQQPMLTLPNMQTAQSGSYSVVVTGCNSVTSSVFSLTVGASVSLNNDGPLSCNKSTSTLTATPAGQGTYVFSAPTVQNGVNTATVSQTGVYSVTLTIAGGCISTASTTVTATQTLPTPFVATQSTPEGLAVQITGGVQYERVKAIDRVNGYEIRQTEQNQTGYFLITQPGPYAITVIGSNGCRATVTGTAP